MNGPDEQSEHAWLVLFTVSLSAMSVLSNSIGMISLLLPRMMAEFAIDVQSVQWVLTTFMLTMVVVQHVETHGSKSNDQHASQVFPHHASGVVTVLVFFEHLASSARAQHHAKPTKETN